jgi:hypothetical protein
VQHTEGDAHDQAGEWQPDDAHVVEGSDGVLLKIEGDEATQQQTGDGAQDGPSPPHARIPFPKPATSSPNPNTAVPATATMPSGVLSGLSVNLM